VRRWLGPPAALLRRALADFSANAEKYLLRACAARRARSGSLSSPSGSTSRSNRSRKRGGRARCALLDRRHGNGAHEQQGGHATRARRARNRRWTRLSTPLKGCRVLKVHGMRMRLRERYLFTVPLGTAFRKRERSIGSSAEPSPPPRIRRPPTPEAACGRHMGSTRVTGPALHATRSALPEGPHRTIYCGDASRRPQSVQTTPA